MKKLISPPSAALAGAAAFAFAATSAEAVITLYSSNFPGASGTNLVGQSVTTSGATGAEHALYGTNASAVWEKLSTDNNPFRANGSVLALTGGAFVAVTPQAGYIYTASVSINTTQNTANWISLGYQNNLTGSSFTGNGNGTLLVRGDGQTSDGQTFLGVGTGSGASFDLGNDGINVVDIILNATDANSANWTMEFIVGGTTVRGPFTKTGDNVAGTGNFADIRYVGFSTNAVTGNLSNFSLTVIPEPTAALLASLGGVLLLRRRRA